MKDHDEIVRDLEARLKGEKFWNVVLPFHPYSGRESDLVAIRREAGRSYCAVFEVKTQDSPTSRRHARQQLQVAYHFWKKYHERVFCFYVTGKPEKFERMPWNSFIGGGGYEE